MTITLPLPPEVETKAMNIPDLQDRLVTFVQHQVDLEQWRAQRYSETARHLVKEAKDMAEQDKAAGLSREDAFRMFREAHERITKKL